MKAYFDEKSRLEDYLQEGKPYCREERQFATLLYSVFLKKREKGKMPADQKTEEIVKACLGSNDIIIEDVYFEVTLMRDFFERYKEESERNKEEIRRNKEDFNRKLLNFVLGGEKTLKDKCLKQLKTKDGIPYNLGGRAAKKGINEIMEEETVSGRQPQVIQDHEIKNIVNKEDQLLIKKKLRLDIAGMMMNATPDILVKYKQKETDEKSYVRGLECKYESKEGEYTAAGVTCKMQYFIQDCIMSFLFGQAEKGVHYPKQPEGGAWAKKKGKERNEYEERKNRVWDEIFVSVFKGILEQENEPGNHINGGVEVIRFAGADKKVKKNKVKLDTEIKIKDLLDAAYRK